MSLAKRIVALAWPVLVGQWAVMLAGTIDTIVTGHASANDLAAMAVGSAIYASLYIGLMGVVMALNPLIANRIGADDIPAAGRNFIDGLWLCLFLAVLGALAIGYPGIWIKISQVPPAVALKVTHYLTALIFALPAALLFRAVYAFNTAISRPKLVMTINLIGLAMKVPLDYALVYGHFGAPQLGAPGCAVATGIVMWTSCAIALWRMHVDPAYRAFEFHFAWPHWARIRELLAIGLPTGASYLIEVTAFTFMALVAARLGIAVTGAHQIAANLASLCYMVPLGFSIATATLVAQALGARDAVLAEKTLDTGLRLTLFFALALASLLLIARPLIIALYTNDPAVASAAFTVIGLVALFHIFDAMQSVSGFVLRAYRRILAPMLVATVALWAVGLVGGTLLALQPIFEGRALGIDGLWSAATLGIGLAAASLGWYAKYIARKVRLDPARIPRLGAEDEAT